VPVSRWPLTLDVPRWDTLTGAIRQVLGGRA
jgi:hypothetical protein